MFKQVLPPKAKTWIFICVVSPLVLREKQTNKNTQLKLLFQSLRDTNLPMFHGRLHSMKETENCCV